MEWSRHPRGINGCLDELPIRKVIDVEQYKLKSAC
jgi:hypothetical protein